MNRELLVITPGNRETKLPLRQIETTMPAPQPAYRQANPTLKYEREGGGNIIHDYFFGMTQTVAPELLFMYFGEDVCELLGNGDRSEHQQRKRSIITTNDFKAATVKCTVYP